MPSKDGRGRIAILKVGPALTFRPREGLFALEQIERELYGMMDFPCSHFRGDSGASHAGGPGPVDQILSWLYAGEAVRPGFQLLRPGPVLPDQQQGTGVRSASCWII